MSQAPVIARQDDPSPETPLPSVRRPWRRRWLSIMLLLLGVVMLAAYLTWPFYAPLVIRWAVTHYAPAGWSVTIDNVQAQYRATRLSGVSFTGPAGLRGDGITLDVVHDRGVLTRDGGDIALRVADGVIRFEQAYDSQADDEPADSNPGQWLAAAVAQFDRLNQIALPGTDALPLGAIQLDDLALEFTGYGVARIDGGGRRGEVVSLTITPNDLAGLNLNATWQADASVAVVLGAPGRVGVAGIEWAGIRGQLDITRGQLPTLVAALTVERARPISVTLPDLLQTMLTDGVALDAAWNPGQGGRVSVDMGSAGQLSLTAIQPALDRDASPVTLAMPLIAAWRGIQVAGWQLDQAPMPLTVQCCTDYQIRITAPSLDTTLAGQGVVITMGGDAKGFYTLNAPHYGATGDLVVQGTHGSVAGTEATTRFGVRSKTTDTGNTITWEVAGDVIAWPAPNMPAVAYDGAGTVAGQSVKAQGQVTVPAISQWPPIPWEVAGSSGVQDLRWRIPTVILPLQTEFLGRTLGLAPPVLRNSITDIQGRVTLAMNGRYQNEISGRVSLDGQFDRLELFGTTLTRLDIKEAVSFTQSGAVTSDANGRLSIDRWVLGEGLAITNLTAGWEWLDDQQLAVAPLRMDVLDGVITIDDFQTRWPALPFTTELTAQGLSLARFAQTIAVPGLTISGDLSGGVTILRDSQAMRLQDGEFSAENGSLQYRGTVTQAAVAEQANLAFEVLEDFQYDKLSMALNGVIGGDQVATLRLVGRNPAVYDGYPVDLNINLSGALDAIAQRSLDALAIPDRLSRQLAPN
ncbi:MAG: YdbH domain-containing protein [Pseudomonadota bacterium]